MSRYAKDQEKYFLAIIRRIMVQKPDTGAVKIAEDLAQLKEPIILTRQYVGQLMKKIHKERVYRANSYLQKEYLAKLEDRLTETDRYLWQILNDKSSSGGSKLGATRELRENYKLILEKIETAGIFKNKAGEVDFNFNFNISKLPQVVLLAMLEKFEQEKLRLQKNGIDKGAEKRNIIVSA